TPGTSEYTSAYDRMAARDGKKIDSSAAAMRTISREEAAKMLRNSTPDQLRDIRKKARQRKGPRVLRDAWLAPLTLDRKSHGPMASKGGLRASDKGFLDISLEDYLKLLVWTGSQKRSDKKGFIPADYAPIFQRVGIDAGMWCDLVWDFKKYFGRSRGAGSPDRMREMAASGGLSFQPGQKRALKCFV
ncbi:MAG: hypothetical protein ABL921_31815, partial [Pirellula sp.]